MSTNTSIVQYKEPKTAAEFVAEQVVNDALIMEWEKAVAQERFFNGWVGGTYGHHACGQVAAAKKNAQKVADFASQFLPLPIARIMTELVGSDYGDGFDFRFIQIKPNGLRVFRVAESLDEDSTIDIDPTLRNWLELNPKERSLFRLYHSEAFEETEFAEAQAEYDLTRLDSKEDL